MSLILDFLSEIVPRFRTETCAFTKDSSNDLGDGCEVVAMTCLGRLEDLDDDTEVDMIMDVSSFGWLFFRAFVSYKYETLKDLTKESEK